jgi:hypothetical protein
LIILEVDEKLEALRKGEEAGLVITKLPDEEGEELIILDKLRTNCLIRSNNPETVKTLEAGFKHLVERIF